MGCHMEAEVRPPDNFSESPSFRIQVHVLLHGNITSELLKLIQLQAMQVARIVTFYDVADEQMAVSSLTSLAPT